MKNILITLSCLMFALAAQGQEDMRIRLLQSIEDNNLTLRSQRELTSARILEARSGNTLPDPTVNYDYLWGSPSELGKTGELNVVQGFDFPTVYSSRSRYGRRLAEQYGSQYAAMRQQVLLQAEMEYINYVSLSQRAALWDVMAENARSLRQSYAKKAEAGDANAIDLNKIDIEMANAMSARNMVRIDLDACLARIENLNGGVRPELPAAYWQAMPMLPPLEELGERYLDEDPRVALLQSAQKAADERVGVAKGEALPKFELGYRREHALGESFNGVKMGMSIPLFESRYSVKRAKAEQAAAGTELRNSQTETLINLRHLYSKAAATLESYNNCKALLNDQRSKELLDKALEAGHISVLDYFTQIAVISQLEETVIDLERQYRQSVAEIMMIDL